MCTVAHQDYNWLTGQRPLLIYYYIRSYWNIQESDAIIMVSYTVLESSGIIAILWQVPPPTGNPGSAPMIKCKCKNVNYFGMETMMWTHLKDGGGGNIRNPTKKNENPKVQWQISWVNRPEKRPHKKNLHVKHDKSWWWGPTNDGFTQNEYSYSDGDNHR